MQPQIYNILFVVFNQNRNIVPLQTKIGFNVRQIKSDKRSLDFHRGRHE